jgi:hypothetical protein
MEQHFVDQNVQNLIRHPSVHIQSEYLHHIQSAANQANANGNQEKYLDTDILQKFLKDQQ